MHHTRVTVALAVLALLSGCSSSGSTPSGSGGGSGSGSSGSGSSSGGSSGAPTRTSVTCAQVGSNAHDDGLGTLNSGSWGSIPTALQQLPSGGSLCGTVVADSDSGFAIPPTTIILSTLWGQDLFNFYNPLVTTAGCTLQPVTTTSGSTAASITSYSCPHGGGTITADGATDNVALTYAASGS